MKDYKQKWEEQSTTHEKSKLNFYKFKKNEKKNDINRYNRKRAKQELATAWLYSEN